MIHLSRTIQIPESELSWEYSRSGGPGGQHVNKTSSRATLRWKVDSPSIPDEVRARLKDQQANRITTEGELLISSQVHREQEANKRECVERFRVMLLKAIERPRIRKATKPTKGSKKRRLEAKRHRSEAKARRRGVE